MFFVVFRIDSSDTHANPKILRTDQRVSHEDTYGTAVSCNSLCFGERGGRRCNGRSQANDREVAGHWKRTRCTYSS